MAKHDLHLTRNIGIMAMFKMSPLHHHFEMSGWSENKIVIVFSIVTLLGCGAAAGLLFL